MDYLLSLNRRVPQASVEELKQSKVIAIRHGQTYANVVSEDQGVFAERTDKALVDSLLTEEGIRKCTEAWPIARELDFEVVLVSPLRRAL